MQIQITQCVDLLVLGGGTEAVRFAIQEQKAGKKVLLSTRYSYFGDDICAPLLLDQIPEWLLAQGLPRKATPMQIKRTLDKMVVEANLPFLFQTWTAAIRDRAVVLVNKDGFFGVSAKAVLDCTPTAIAARLAGIPFSPVLTGERPATCRVLEASDSPADFECEGKHFRLRCYDTKATVPNDSISARFQASLEARMNCWNPMQELTADRPEIQMGDSPCGMDPAGFVFLPGQPLAYGPQGNRKCIAWEPPVLGEYDVAVAGGGTAGAAAGISAARAAAKTLVVEHLSHLGGISTQGRIASYYFGLNIGFTKELDELFRPQGTPLPNAVFRDNDTKLGRWPVEAKQHFFEKLNYEAGCEIWYESLFAKTIFTDGRIQAMLVATPYGAGLVQARQFLDCTGDAELAFSCGAPTIYAAPEEPAMQGAGMCPVVPGHNYFNTDYMFTVDASNRDTTRAFLTGRHRMGHCFDMAQIPGTRERRRILGDIILRATDFFGGRKYEDTILLSESNFDTHGFTVAPLVLFHPTNHDAILVEIPLRALLSPGVANLLTTGLGISAERDALPLIRMEADVHNQGYAAGMVAAQAALQGTELRKLDLKPIQEALRAIGMFDPVTSVAKPLVNKDAQIFEAPDLPALEADFRSEPDFEKALRLALLGSRIGMTLLEDTVGNSPWDDGWDYRGMGQFGKSSSRLDVAIRALSQLGANWGFLRPRLLELTPGSQFSHFRACCFFLMHHPAPEAAPILEALLAQFQCHAIPDYATLLRQDITDDCDNSERNFQLREIYLAGALHACAPDSKLANDFLHAYRQGLHRLYAIYAELWSK